MHCSLLEYVPKHLKNVSLVAMKNKMKFTFVAQKGTKTTNEDKLQIWWLVRSKPIKTEPTSCLSEQAVKKKTSEEDQED